jgi:hypothetical protein
MIMRVNRNMIKELEHVLDQPSTQEYLEFRQHLRALRKAACKVPLTFPHTLAVVGRWAHPRAPLKPLPLQ